MGKISSDQSCNVVFISLKNSCRLFSSRCSHVKWFYRVTLHFDAALTQLFPMMHYYEQKYKHPIQDPSTHFPLNSKLIRFSLISHAPTSTPKTDSSLSISRSSSSFSSSDVLASAVSCHPCAAKGVPGVRGMVGELVVGAEDGSPSLRWRL